MMNDGLVTDRIARDVLNKLKEIAKGGGYYETNGDLKENGRIIQKSLL